MALRDSELRAWLRQSPKGKVRSLGRMLYLKANGDGAGYAYFRYRRPGAPRPTVTGVGAYPVEYTLAELFELRDALIVDRRKGIDPQANMSERRAARQASLLRTAPLPSKRNHLEILSVAPPITADSSFWEVALNIHADHTAGTCSRPWTQAYGAAWLAGIRNHLAPVASRRAVAVTRRDLAEAIAPVWGAHPRTAKATLQAAAKVFDRLTALDLYDKANPATLKNLRHLLPRADESVTARPAMHYGQAPAFMRELAGIEDHSARAGELVIMTACRISEVVGAQWDEIDFDAGVWTIPADRMKMRRPHRIPITPTLAAKLHALPVVEGKPRYLFPSPVGANQTLHRAALGALQKRGAASRHGWDGWTWHGFRATFKSWATDTQQDQLAVEYCLAHVLGGVEGSYQRSDLLDQRRAIMTRWHAYLLEGKANVVEFAGRKAG